MKIFKILLISMLFFYACEDPCDDCLNGATCVDEACVCLDGFSGENCELEWRADYLGDWSGESSCDFDTTLTPSIANITADTADGMSVIIDLDGLAFNGTIDTNGNLTVPTQTIEEDGVSLTFSGTGSISNNQLTIVIDAQGAGVCTAVLDR